MIIGERLALEARIGDLRAMNGGAVHEDAQRRRVWLCAIGELARTQDAEETTLLRDDPRTARFVDEDDCERHQHDGGERPWPATIEEDCDAAKENAGDR